ncbi:MAG: InlB B-repeat-containing protein, partial [Clostridia bacterium]|nr:InlB B-repeat-containing protein [Clostridia bacterium]
MTKKIIISVVSVLILSIVGCFIGINWNSIKTLLSGSKIYTYEQIQDSYDKGYKDANTNETNYLEQLDYYRNLVEDNELEILNLKNTVNILERTNENNTQTIADLETQKQTLEIDVENLQLIKTENEETITNLNLQISLLRTRVVELTADKTANQNEIVSLKNQILNLQTLNTQLQRTNELNAETITSLNNQIANLNSQISEMNTQVSNNSSVVNTLNNRITELEKTVSYYEQYIANLENGEQVVATFEFDGSVYNIQIVNKNDYAGVVTPTSTDYVKFNYWVVNGEQVDLTTYALTTNTTFVANVSYYYDVKFMIDTEVFNSQIVEKDTFAVLPEAPTKDGYVFDGWTSNGIDIVDTTSTAITQNIIFTAKFTKVHNVTFIYEDSTLEIQQVKNGQYAQTVSVENTNYKKFNGWLLNGAIVDLTSYKITADTVLTANITYSYDVTFIVDGIIYSTQIIEAGMYATVPISPKKDDLSFKGWSLNGSDIIKIINYPIYENTTYIAVFGVKSFESVAFSGANFFSPVYIWTDGENAYYSEGTKQFVLNKETFTWESKTWNITDSNFSGSKVWTYKGNVYYSSYVLDKETSTWVAANWNGYIPSGIYIWTDGEDYFYSNWSTHYMLKQETNTWEKITFTGLTNFYGDYIWTDGENAYYSRSSDQYVLNKS